MPSEFSFKQPRHSLCGIAGAVEIYLEAPALEAVTVVRLECGEYVENEVLEGCWRVSARSERDELTAQAVESIEYPAVGCLPVPEPGFGAVIGWGVAWLGLALVLGPVVGRRLRVLARSNPTAPDPLSEPLEGGSEAPELVTHEDPDEL